MWLQNHDWVIVFIDWLLSSYSHTEWIWGSEQAILTRTFCGELSVSWDDMVIYFCSVFSPWRSLMAGELRSLLTTAAAAPAASTHRRPPSRRGAAAAAAIHQAYPPSALLDLRMEAPARQRTFCMTGIKVRRSRVHCSVEAILLSHLLPVYLSTWCLKKIIAGYLLCKPKYHSAGFFTSLLIFKQKNPSFWISLVNKKYNSCRITI